MELVTKPKSLGNPSLFYQSKLWASGVTSRILRPTSGDSPRPLDAAGLRRLVEASTTKQKEYFHVVFTEIIDTKVQGDWRDSYGAKVQVFKGGQKVTFLRDGKKIDTLRGSTLPNFRPGKDKPKGWTYSVVQATCAFPTDLQGRFYTWARTKRDAQHDGAPCLRLTSKVPTVNIGSERANEMTLDELLLEFGNESKSGRYFQYASNILIHSGHKMTWRGSAGCLTIHPDDAELLLFMCLEGVKGTLEVNRGIYDKSSSTSRCY